uniref:cyclic nucleotide-gated ion channel 1-like n=1 Tax=Fragaria vesca subsp. vesca TaxID=101020 RepID=UPI0005CB5C35|nr:PREDICTED: cyclic nucleotide-gated ion channel 1-like [Fragaria vesca subsp. vesca]XP_011462119.1 PREDICTED: cyclic nucleotide-gated ion channel 1-like [Fragaria vesca subsp. vesca]XP_011462123.1 PREDICTED: cyclic nucleotide-gated ion channel 1-like [Fragaria vesca subsp. vesca]
MRRFKINMPMRRKTRENELAASEENRKKRLPEITSWAYENGLPEELKKKIMDNLTDNLRADLEVNTKNLHSILRLEDIREVKYHLCLPILRKVSVFSDWEEELLKQLCERLSPVIYPEGFHVLREGEPTDKTYCLHHERPDMYLHKNN